MSKTYLIIGTSAAGLGAVYRLRMLNKQARIICISSEIEDPYNKCLIVDYLAGKKERSEVLTLTGQQAQAHAIERILGFQVTEIDVHSKKIIGSDNASQCQIPYDFLCIATGCRPRVPNIIEENIKGIFSFYSLANVDSMLLYMAAYSVKTAVIIGAGFTGMEAADALAQYQIKIIIVDKSEQVLPFAIDKEGSVFIEFLMQKHNVCFYPQTSIVHIEHKDQHVVSVTLSDGRTIATNMVIYAIGSQPNTEFAQKAGLQLRNGYIAVNKQLQTNIPTIYAAGDCAVIPGMLCPSFTWPIAMYQGTMAAYSMNGQVKEYIAAPSVISSAFFGIKFASCGLIQPDDVHQSRYTVCVQTGEDFYHRFVYEGTTLRGFVLIGNTQRLAELRRAIVVE